MQRREGGRGGGVAYIPQPFSVVMNRLDRSEENGDGQTDGWTGR
jgi:hypothetical protein